MKWIFLRGLGRGFGHWGSFIEQAKAAFPQDQFYFLDLPGNGLLNREKSPLRVSDYLSSLEKQLAATDFYKKDGRVVGVGLSLGGMVMTEWALQKPALFDQLFLINTSASNFSRPWHRLSLPVLLYGIRQIFIAKEIEKVELNSLLITTSLTVERIKKEFQKSYQQMIDFSLKYPIPISNIIRQLVAAAYYRFPTGAPAPTILINGGKDRFVHPGCSLAISQRWNVPIFIHPEAGHDITFEEPAWVLDLFKKQVRF